MAKARTGPGSGHLLTGGAVGLPAICAYLASQRFALPSFFSEIFQRMSEYSDVVMGTMTCLKALHRKLRV